MTASGSKGGQETPELTASCTAVVRSFLEKNEADRPIYVTPERLKEELGRRGFAEFAEFAAGQGTALLARKEIGA